MVVRALCAGACVVVCCDLLPKMKEFRDASWREIVVFTSSATCRHQHRERALSHRQR